MYSMNERSQNKKIAMKELTKITQTSKSTILHYLHLGLLPKPVKTSLNMAYYDPECIDRIQLIKYLQKYQRLTLQEIKKYIEKRNISSEITAQLYLNVEIFKKLDNQEKISKQEFCKLTELSSEQVDELLQLQLLMPLEKDQFDYDDVQMGRAYTYAAIRGMDFSDLTYYVKLGKEIINHELSFRAKSNQDMPRKEDLNETIQMVKNARLARAYILDRLFQYKVSEMRIFQPPTTSSESNESEK